MLRQIRLEQFRNFATADFSFDSKTVFVGRNGVGKSNIIEAIRLLSVGKSCKTSRFEEVIRFGQPYTRLTATIDVDDKTEQTVDFFYGQQFSDAAWDRELRLNNQPIALIDYLGTLVTVLFLPSDIEIVLGSPQTRRRYLDSVIWQSDAQFRRDSLELQGVLRERSALLFLLKTHGANVDQLQPWNELLNGLTDRIRSQRQNYVDFLNRYIVDKKAALPGLTVECRYQATPIDFDAVYIEEVRLAQNLVGPQRDELEIRLNDRLARRFASRGQARAITSLLKAAELAYLAEVHPKARPTVLLDDLLSELDSKRAGQLLELFSAEKSQLIATSVASEKLFNDWKAIELS